MGRGNNLKNQRIANWEEHLIRRAQAGESVAMELLMDTYRTQLRYHALRMLRDGEDADDAVQESFLKAFKAIGSFHAGRPFLPWLMRICSNCAVDIIRNRKPGHETLDKHEHALYDSRMGVAEGVERRLRAESLRSAIGRLPEKYRRIVMMRHYDHMDVNEIADALDIPEGTIKSWLFRARAILKKDLTVALS
ncbi:MAG: sigma-70 family RNA polymerase sigma factor [Armatimonadetes bacterium]|nr:sigma-70 family RNA polymerase sigma factor [Armatimonadota bacterium]